jgi:hypothetical protein
LAEWPKIIGLGAECGREENTIRTERFFSINHSSVFLVSLFQFWFLTAKKKMSALIVDKKTVHRLGSSLIESNATKPSVYAMKLMQKMGWKEGQGLGRNEDGIAKHITLSKRDDNLGLGHDNAASAEGAKDHWWNNHFSEKLAAFTSSIGKKNKKKNKKSKDKKSRESSSSSSSDSDDSDSEAGKKSPSAASGADPSLDELFKLTGGKLFGMRARMEQKGKIRRTESGNHLNIVETVTTKTESRTESTKTTITTQEKTEINVETQKEDVVEENPDSDNTEDKKKKKKDKKEKKKSKKRKSSEMDN